MGDMGNMAKRAVNLSIKKKKHTKKEGKGMNKDREAYQVSISIMEIENYTTRTT